MERIMMAVKVGWGISLFEDSWAVMVKWTAHR